MSEDWQPKERTLLRLMEIRQISRKQAELQAEHFKNSTIASDNKYNYKRFDAALINWVMGEYYKEIPESVISRASSREQIWKMYEEYENA